MMTADRLEDAEAPGDGGGPPAPPPEDPGDSPIGRWASSLPLMIVLVLAVLVATGAVVLWNQNQDLESDDDDRREAAEVASDFTTAVLSYDHRNLSGSVEAAVALSTPDWGREYENAWFAEQQPIVEATRAVAEVAVDDVLLGDAINGVVPAVVTFNATINSEVGRRNLTGSYIRLDLMKVDGEWRVDDMLFLASTDQQLDPAENPTPTTVPG
jgi:hypothetical protein